MIHQHFFVGLVVISYPDQIFDKQQTRLDLLVNTGYNVVTYVNEGESTLLHSQHLTVSKKMVPFLDQKLVDKHEVWLVNIKGWHARAAGSLKAPIPMHIDFASVEEVYALNTDRLKKNVEEKKAMSLDLKGKVARLAYRGRRRIHLEPEKTCLAPYRQI